MRRTLLSLIFLLLALGAEARERYDTSYIRRPEKNWLIRTRTEVGTEFLRTTAVCGSDIYKLDLDADVKIRQHFGFGWKNLILGFGINFSGKKIGWDLALRMLGNRFGTEIMLYRIRASTGNLDVNGTVFPIEHGYLQETALKVRNYYAFNGKRFSMPAVLTQGFRQYKSAGSGLLTMAFSSMWLTRGKGISEAAMPLERQTSSFFGMGGGYGYNWVPTKHWLIHFSLIENVGVPWEDTKIKGVKHKAPLTYAGFLTTGRAAVFFYPGTWYFGLSAMGEHFISPDIKRTEKTSSLDVRGQLSIGVRF